MKYLLVVGFYCNVYRKEPQARLFVGDKLIDEFNIKHCIDKDYISFEFFKDYHTLQPRNRETSNSLLIKTMPNLQFYEIDVKKKQDLLELRIDINNNDNNYNNGFMTKSTLLQLRIFSFFPLNKKILLRLKKINYKNRLTKNYAWEGCIKNAIFDLTSNDFQWNKENGQIITNTPGNLLKKYYIGGSGCFKCELVKKYGMFIAKLKKPYRYSLDYSIIYFYDKYQQYANQRNTD